MSPGVSVAPNETAERRTAAVAGFVRVGAGNRRRRRRRHVGEPCVSCLGAAKRPRKPLAIPTLLPVVANRRRIHHDDAGPEPTVIASSVRLVPVKVAAAAVFPGRLMPRRVHHRDSDRRRGAPVGLISVIVAEVGGGSLVRLAADLKKVQRHHAEYDRVVALLLPWPGPQIPSSLT
jgi:hypothetical protein